MILSKRLRHHGPRQTRHAPHCCIPALVEQYNLLYREEEREMLPQCADQGVGVIPWSPLARGRLTRDWDRSTSRAQNDAFAQKMYDKAEEHDKEVLKVVKRIAEEHHVPRGHVALAWLWSKPEITAPIVGATKVLHVTEAIDAVNFSLSGGRDQSSGRAVRALIPLKASSLRCREILELYRSRDSDWPRGGTQWLGPTQARHSFATTHCRTQESSASAINYT